LTVLQEFVTLLRVQTMDSDGRVRPVIREARECLKQAAIEAGERQEVGRVLPPATVDVSHLTPDQLFAEQRVLREAREKIEQIRAGKPGPVYFWRLAPTRLRE
jgi:hypothetical protein